MTAGPQVEPAAATEAPAAPPLPPGPVPKAGLRAFLGLERIDVTWLVVLVGLAFFLRAASPIFPDFLSHPLGGAPLNAWGAATPQTPTSCADVPVGPGGATEKHCGYVFDEVYFTVFAADTLHRPAVDFFDPEPPLAKLLMAPPMAALGFGNRWSWRLSTMIAGSLLVGLVYLIARRLRRDRFFAVAAATFVCLDGLAFVESRTGVIDTIAIFFVVLFYYAFLLHWQARTRTQWRATLYAMAVIAGLAFGAKLTALAPLAVAAVFIGGRLLEPFALRAVPALRRIAGPGGGEAVMWRDAAGRRVVLHYVAALLVMAAAFGACYSRYLTIEHRSVYTYTGCDPMTGVQGYPTTQTVPVVHVGSVPLPNIPVAIANIKGDMAAALSYHSTECRRHPYESRWYTWPVDAKPVLFYVDYTSYTTVNGAREIGWISDLGNPVLWWLALPALLFCFWTLTRGPTAWRLGVALLGVGAVMLLAGGFAANEMADTVRVQWSVPLVLGVVSMIAFGVAVVLSGVISRRFVPAFIVLGFLVALTMWMFGNMRRILFLYHMLGALPFMALALAYALTALRHARLSVAGRSLSLAPVAYAGVGAVIAGFVFFYPMWTGAPLPQADHDLRLWLPDW